METTNAIQQIYIGLLGRAADQEGLQYWTDEIEAGTLTLEQLRANIVEEQPEYEATFGGQTRAQVVSQLYANLFNRAPDDEGLQYWVNGEGASVNIDQLVLALVNGAAAADTLVLDNRTEVANYYTEELGAEGSFDAELAGAVIADVDGARASVTQAKASVDNGDIAAPGTGGTFTLTASADNFVGTGGNDTFVSAQQNGNNTLAAGDSIDGGAGTDRLNVFGTANAANFANANVTNVEQVYAQFDGQIAGTPAINPSLNVSANSGVQQAWVSKGDVGAGGATVQLTKAQTAGVEGTVAGAGGLTVDYTNASAAAGDVANLALNGANTTAGGVQIGDTVGGVVRNVETLNVSATGANRLGNVTDQNSVTTYNITGAGSVNATLAGNAITTVNAADNTGGVTLNTTASAGNNQTITGGTGNDTITTTYTGLSNQDTINLGDGVDSLIFTNAATFNDATTAARLSNVTNVEKLGTVGAALTVDGDLVSQNIFTTSGTGSFAITDAANNATLEFGAGQAGTSTAAMKLNANTVNVELNGSTAAVADVDGNGLTVTGSTTVNLSTNGTAGVGANTLALTAADNQTVVITGSQDLTLTTTAATGTTGFTLNGADATGKLNITGTNAADTIIGGAGDDTLNGGVSSAAVTGVKEVFTATLVTAADGTTITFDGVTYTAAGGDGATVASATTAFVADYNAAAGANYVAVDNGGTVTFTAKTAGAVTDVTAADFTGTANGAGNEAATVTVGTQGVDAVAAVPFTADTYTGGAGKDTFIVGTNGAATADVADVITDFVSKTDKIDFAAYNVAGSATNYKEATSAVADFATAKAAADAVFADGTTAYSVQQVGSDSYVFASDAAGSTSADHVVKLTGVALDGIEFADIVA